MYSVTTFAVGGSSGHGMIMAFMFARQPRTNASKEGGWIFPALVSLKDCDKILTVSNECVERVVPLL